LGLTVKSTKSNNFQPFSKPYKNKTTGSVKQQVDFHLVDIPFKKRFSNQISSGFKQEVWITLHSLSTVNALTHTIILNLMELFDLKVNIFFNITP